LAPALLLVTPERAGFQVQVDQRAADAVVQTPRPPDRSTLIRYSSCPADVGSVERDDPAGTQQGEGALDRAAVGQQTSLGSELEVVQLPRRVPTCHGPTCPIGRLGPFD
jgi:hypothetical protein